MSTTNEGTTDSRIGAASERLRAVVDDHLAAVFLGPPLLVILFVFVYPVLWMCYQSLFVTFPGLEQRFAPLFNYRAMFTSPAFWRYAGQTLAYSLGSLAVSFTAGLILALAINHVRRRWLRASYTTLIMFSWAIPLAVVALMWRWILVARPYGLANRLLLDLGLVESAVPFLSHGLTALVAVTLADGWLRMPFAMVVFLAGRQAIPQRAYDAAAVDGTTTLQAFRHVTLPHLRPYVAVVVLINWMFAFRAFSIVYPMTEGGPGTATTTLPVEIYRRGMVDLDFGYGSAMAVFLVSVTLVLAVVYVRVILRRVEE